MIALLLLVSAISVLTAILLLQAFARPRNFPPGELGWEGGAGYPAEDDSQLHSVSPRHPALQSPPLWRPRHDSRVQPRKPARSPLPLDRDPTP